MAPREGEGLEQLAARLALGEAVKCRRENEVFYLVKGATPPGYVLASSSPVYVFRADGSLLEWIDDPGDRPSAMDRWHAPVSEPVELGDALREVSQANGK